MKNVDSWDVFLVTDSALSQGRTNLQIIEAAVAGGISVVQLREKNLSARDFISEAFKIKDFLAQRDIPMIINDRLDVALAVDADGVHLGQTDLPIEIARKLLGPNKIIGWSVNDLRDLTKEAEDLVDYFAISPVFFTSTKKDISMPWGTEGVAAARSLTSSCLVGIGGIGFDNASEVIQAGLNCVAVVSAIVSADDPVASTMSLVEKVRDAKRAQPKTIIREVNF
jgi:thiamine-phosphate pyrophosphorylase